MSALSETIPIQQFKISLLKINKALEQPLSELDAQIESFKEIISTSNSHVLPQEYCKLLKDRAVLVDTFNTKINEAYQKFKKDELNAILETLPISVKKSFLTAQTDKRFKQMHRGTPSLSYAQTRMLDRHELNTGNW